MGIRTLASWGKVIKKFKLPFFKQGMMFELAESENDWIYIGIG